jgi:two-component system sensor histidine kinase QseC
MRQSLRRRLLIILSFSVVTAWLASAFFSYLDARNLIDEMLDTRLVQTADMILAFVERQPLEDLDGLSLSEDGEAMIGYAVWVDANTIGIRSSNMPIFAKPTGPGGFSDKVADNESWRVYRSERRRGRVVEVAQRQTFRAAFAESVAAHIMHPVWFAVPLLGALIWLSVKWGLAPLQTVARNVEQRSADDLKALDPNEGPLEVRPLVAALNNLFGRIRALLDKERRFTADAAHELRTPLAAVKTHAQVAQRATQDGERDQAVGHVIQGADRAIRLVEQLLVQARLDHQGVLLARGRVDLAEVAVESIKDLMSAANYKRVDLGISGWQDGSAIVTGNGDLLQLLAHNLLDNAVRYTPEGGTVTADIGRQDGRVTLSVSDTGPGIPEPRRTRVFDRFYRIEGSGEQGSGLGLSIVARIAEMHGASIDMTDGPDQSGLTVTVAFPATGQVPQS